MFVELPPPLPLLLLLVVHVIARRQELLLLSRLLHLLELGTSLLLPLLLSLLDWLDAIPKLLQSTLTSAQAPCMPQASVPPP